MYPVFRYVNKMLVAGPPQGLCWTVDRYDPQYRRHPPDDAGKATSGFEECQQVGIELVLVRVCEAVGCARVYL